MSVVGDIYNAVDSAAPFNTAMEFDNVGLLAGGMDEAISRAIIALDITNEVLEEAEEKGAGLIISHHPVIFDPLKSLVKGTVPYKLASLGINALCCHTNLDIADEVGVNSVFAEKLGLRSIEKCGNVLIGHINPITACEYAYNIKTALTAEKVTYTCGNNVIRKIAVCCGAGGGFIFEAFGNCDAFVTGEAHHDELIFAQNNHFPIIVTGHYESEKIFGSALKGYLESRIHDVSFMLSEAEQNPVKSI